MKKNLKIEQIIPANGLVAVYEDTSKEPDLTFLKPIVCFGLRSYEEDGESYQEVVTFCPGGGREEYLPAEDEGNFITVWEKDKPFPGAKEMLDWGWLESEENIRYVLNLLDHF